MHGPLAYYNERDAYAAQWLRNLIAAGHIAPGDVDERSIEDVHPSDLDGYTQCHFFAGIGIWSYALRLAGWPDDRPVWTGSCPCQPFSTAGQGLAFDDERHLWPHFHHLIRERRPGVVLGEQVASKDGLAWLDLVHTDMEAACYAFGSVDLCAAGVGAPHIRQRLYWVADSLRYGSQGGLRRQSDAQRQALNGSVGRRDAVGWLADSLEFRREQGRPSDATEERDGLARDGSNVVREPAACPTNSHWRAVDWLFCRDGKWRPVEPGTFPMAHGAASRMGRLRAYGNGLCTETAAAFIRAYLGA